MKNATLLLTLVIVVPAVAVLFIAWLRTRDKLAVREQRREHDLAEMAGESDGEPEWFFDEAKPVPTYSGPDRRGRRWGNPVPWEPLPGADGLGKNSEPPE